MLVGAQRIWDSLMNPSDDDLTLAELLPWLEFGSWTMLVLAPVLYYVNGPSVSPDQAVVRTCLVVVAAAGALTLRLVNWRRGRSSRTDDAG